MNKFQFRHFCPRGHIWQHLEIFLIAASGAGRKLPLCIGHNREAFTQNVNSAEVEKP